MTSKPDLPQFELRVPDGDVHERSVCRDCGYIRYENPKLLVGVVCTWEDRVLLCKRDIEPRRGFWTLPAGFMELGESPQEGAKREAWEEARARLEIDALLAVYSLNHIGQVQLLYRAKLVSPDVEAADETQEVRLFQWDEIPWDDLAFPTVRWALNAFQEVRDEEVFPPFTNPEGASSSLEENG